VRVEESPLLIEARLEVHRDLQFAKPFITTPT